MYKLPTATAPITLDFSTDLGVGETVASVVSLTVAPSGTLALAGQVIASPHLNFTVSGGTDGVNYLIRATVLTSTNRILTRDTFVAVQVEEIHPTESPDTYRTILDEVFAGESAKAMATFILPDDPVVAGALGTWEVIDADGVSYASGQAIEVTGTSVVSVGGKVEMFAVITVPSDMPPSTAGTKYQLRWTLTLADGSTHYLFDNFTVKSPVEVPHQGSLSTVELNSSSTILGITLPQRFDHVEFQLFHESGGELSEVVPAINYQPVAGGHFYSREVSTLNVPPSLEPYVIVWKYWLDAYPTMKYTDSGQLYIINPSMASVMSDLRSFVNKANEEDFVSPTDLMSYMRGAADDFNGFSNVTSFTMTNAKSGIRSAWLMFAQVRLLRARYLEEGSKAFDFSGQAVNLSQDRTAYLEAMASGIQGQIDSAVPNLKYQLSMRGHTSGDGSSMNFVPGTAARLGIGVHPLSRYGARGIRRILLLGR